jgi:hypothetical protein
MKVMIYWLIVCVFLVATSFAKAGSCDRCILGANGTTYCSPGWDYGGEVCHSPGHGETCWTSGRCGGFGDPIFPISPFSTEPQFKCAGKDSAIGETFLLTNAMREEIGNINPRLRELLDLIGSVSTAENGYFVPIGAIDGYYRFNGTDKLVGFSGELTLEKTDLLIFFVADLERGPIELSGQLSNTGKLGEFDFAPLHLTE